jgi:hypothetical protein
MIDAKEISLPPRAPLALHVITSPVPQHIEIDVDIQGLLRLVPILSI